MLLPSRLLVCVFVAVDLYMTGYPLNSDTERLAGGLEFANLAVELFNQVFAGFRFLTAVRELQLAS